MSDPERGPRAEDRDAWTCPRCGAVHYLHMDGDATDQVCGCMEDQ